MSPPTLLKQVKQKLDQHIKDDKLKNGKAASKYYIDSSESSSDLDSNINSSSEDDKKVLLNGNKN
jgi:hypothetical protein